MRESPITWRQDNVAGVPVQRHVGHAGAIEVGAVEFDGSNRMWIWSSPLAEAAWGWGSNEDAAKQALEVWLKGWLENFRPFFQESRSRRGQR
jgi:hypothetical protein